MAPFTCKVVDALERGLPGVLAVLDCRDEMYNNFAILESNSDENGDILVWFPTTFGERAFKAQTMDTAITPRMSLTFYPDNGSIPPASPWISIQTDLYLPGEGEHKIILHVEQTPRLEYSPRFGSTEADMTATSFEKPPAFSAAHHTLEPPPLLLPSPVTAHSCRRGDMDSSHDPLASGGQKSEHRKRAGRKRPRVADEEGPRRKKERREDEPTQSESS